VAHRHLDRFEAALPQMSPEAAAAPRRLLDRIDSRVRRLLGEPTTASWSRASAARTAMRSGW
jgi:hypothetical protein